MPVMEAQGRGILGHQGWGDESGHSPILERGVTKARELTRIPSVPVVCKALSSEWAPLSLKTAQ